MKRLVKVFFLLLFIGVIFSFVGLRSMANGSDNNLFNQKYRAMFDKYPLARDILGLHFDGDGRFDYLDRSKSKLWVEIDTVYGTEIPQASLDLLAEKIKSSTGKDVVYYVSDKEIPAKQIVTQDDVKKLVSNYKNFHPNDGAYLYLLFLQSYEPDPLLLGSTYQEDGVILYDQALKDLTKASPETYPQYVESTILHEFGHQLGLPHNEQKNCLMNSHADTNNVVRETTKSVIVDFCDYEKKLIQSML